MKYPGFFNLLYYFLSFLLYLGGGMLQKALVNNTYKKNVSILPYHYQLSHSQVLGISLQSSQAPCLYICFRK